MRQVNRISGRVLGNGTTGKVHGERYETGEWCPDHDRPLIGIWSEYNQNWQRTPGCPECDPYYAESVSVEEFLRAANVPKRFKSKRLSDFRKEEPGQQEVLNAANWFLAHGEGSTGLLLLGGVGTGKTHLACAVLRCWIEQSRSGLFKDCFDLLQDIKATWGKTAVESEQGVLSQFNRLSLLVVDEVGVQFGSQTERLLLTRLINRRYGAMRPTILVSNLPLSEFEEVVGERVVDRFREGGKVLAFDWESQRSKQ